MIGAVIFVAIYFLVAGAVFYAAFCRLTITNKSTAAHVRLWLWLVSSGAVFSIMATLIYGYRPTGWHLVLLILVFVGQMNTKSYWISHMPGKDQKNKDEYPCQLTR